MNADVRLKPGETFLLECQVTDSAGAALDITGWDIESQVRDLQGALIAALVVDIHTPATGQYQLSYADTTAWPHGLAQMDIAYTDSGGRALTTETLILGVEREVTLR